jgi:superfamily II DNA or RNA helicase
MIITIDYDETRNLGVIKSNSLDVIREAFSEEDKQAKIKKRVSGFKYIPTRKYCITKSGKFELGMTNDLLKYIKSIKSPHRITFTDNFKKVFLCGFSFHSDKLAELNKPDNYKERYYQEESIRQALKLGNGIFLLKTAAGKTYISAQLIATIQKNCEKTKTLIIVPTIQLVEQTYSDFLHFGFDKNKISKWSGKNKLNSLSDIIIASSSILLSKSQDISILNQISLLIIDECHVFKKGNQINQILKHINTRHRYGFTGTLPEEKIDQWNIIGKVGPVIYELSREEMVKHNFIADAEIKFLHLNYKNEPDYKKININKPLENYDIETKFIESNNFRNNIIKSICTKLDKNILIVVEHLEHGKNLYSLLCQEKNKKVFFIRGSVEIEDREKYKNIIEKEDNHVCIAISKIFSTGINIKNLHYILFASAGKAKIKLIQSIGRGVRLHENKNKLFIFDITDNLLYGAKHLKRRKEIYEEEGFKTTTKEFTE